MKFRSIAWVGATALCSMTIASTSYARDYSYRSYRDGCTDRIHSSGTTGAILGGLAGAALGANLAAHHGGRTGGALLGAAAGAAVGNNLARSSTKSSCRGSRHAYRTSSYAYRHPGRYEGYGMAPYDGYGYQGPYYAQPFVSAYGGYDDYGSAYEPPRHSRHHAHHDHDDDDDDGDE